MNVLVLSCGSASIKFAVIDAKTQRESLRGVARHLGSPRASLDWRVDGRTQEKPLGGPDRDGARMIAA